MGSLLRSKFFWILLVTLVPFCIAWAKVGLEGAVVVLFIGFILAICIFAGRGNKNRRRFSDYDFDDDGDD